LFRTLSISFRFQLSDDAATNAVYVPPEIQPEVIGDQIVEENEATAPPDSASEQLISELQVGFLGLGKLLRRFKSVVLRVNFSKGKFCEKKLQVNFTPENFAQKNCYRMRQKKVHGSIKISFGPPVV
jgi:hypothetical protein